MASTIIIKNGAGGSTPSSLKQGELAINVDSGSLYYGTSGSSNAVSSSFHIQNSKIKLWNWLILYIIKLKDYPAAS